ncbi:DUF3667 domain-containing protein [Pedobacter sp. KBS0701]|uniref:DUF3667 domain-containing protein n=1 Tax=unclassified Pedobacter TaxID=2628915 RepID=UPI001FED77D9|nr:DUF3667 domain-containing protein [Pedobacter sp. KBS0701]
MINCKICNSEVEKKYCPDCGHPVSLKRINAHYLLHEIEHVLHFERGILYTMRELLLRPGTNIKHFFSEDRSRLVKPVIFIIITSLIYSIISHFFHIQSMVSHDLAAQSTAAKFMDWTESHMGYSNILIGALIALFIKLFFRKYTYNYFEILILLCFVMGFGMLIFALFAFLEGVTHVDFKITSSILAIGYCTWAIGHFFNPGKIASYLKALFAYLLGMMSYYMLAILIGTLIDSIIK